MTTIHLRWQAGRVALMVPHHSGARFSLVLFYWRLCADVAGRGWGRSPPRSAASRRHRPRAIFGLPYCADLCLTLRGGLVGSDTSRAGTALRHSNHPRQTARGGPPRCWNGTDRTSLLWTAGFAALTPWQRLFTWAARPRPLPRRCPRAGLLRSSARAAATPTGRRALVTDRACRGLARGEDDADTRNSGLSARITARRAGFPPWPELKSAAAAPR